MPIGPAPSRESYLRIDRILDAAKKTGADAIHPGYGFLAENANFARACRDAGIIFIGPSPESIEAMGSKTESRQRMQAAGVPVVPGLTEAVKSFDEIDAFARDAGFPIMIKASAGGGGKGMRLVEREDDLRSSFERVTSEAQSFFGDAAVYAEKFIASPRHIEVQILGDQHGNIVHVGERECTLQRRHQKVVEECPSPVVDARAARAPRRDGGEGRGGGQLLLRGHDRVPDGTGQAVLLPRDEHAAAGRASGHGDGVGHRSRQSAASRRARRETWASRRAISRRTATPSSAACMPRIRRGSSRHRRD